MVIQAVSTFLSIMNYTAMKIHIQVFVDVCFLFSIDWLFLYPGFKRKTNQIIFQYLYNYWKSIINSSFH